MTLDINMVDPCIPSSAQGLFGPICPLVAPIREKVHPIFIFITNW
jgi:hypothetical protein